MTDMIAVSSDVLAQLHAWSDRDDPAESTSDYVRELEGVADIIAKLPRPPAPSEVCPVCGRDAVHVDGSPRWHCASSTCGACGPYYDDDGAKRNAMARPARLLREIEEACDAGILDGPTSDEVIAGRNMAFGTVLGIINGGGK